MPIYDYRCDACGHAFSAVQPMAAEPLDRCPKCGARPRRVPSRPAIVFKGSGWHATDYPRKTAGSAEKSEKSEQSEKSEKTEPKASSGGDAGKRGGAKADDAAAAN